ncbi:diacylglycerol kinase theta [Spatholobus suberectus]|nr:diacylglycerol kinase theta [Spatholobus suberectus]
MAPVKKITMEHFTHPGHPLTHISSNTQFLCDGCMKLGNGNRYRCGTCKACDFDVHPLCTQLPQHAHHPLHAHHVLRLQQLPGPGPMSSGWCMVCKTASCNAWG